MAFLLYGVMQWILLPTILLQGVSTFVLGLAVQATFGLLLLPMTLIWLPFLGFLLGTSRLWFAAPVLRPVLILPGVLISNLGALYVGLMPSMGEWDSRMNKMVICHSWPAMITTIF